MAETPGSTNIDIAKELAEHGGHARSGGAGSHQEYFVEILEAVVVAIVAVTTAWSGYESALWTGIQSQLYVVAQQQQVNAAAATNVSNEYRLYNASTVAQWLNAEAAGNAKLAAVYERRVLPEFRPAFEAWKKLDPIGNPHAPAGPLLMPQYRDAGAAAAARYTKAAGESFAHGDRARHSSDDYVRVTVVLATVLLLVTINQRFRVRPVRIGLGIFAIAMLIAAIYRIATLPNAIWAS
jgi:hypothetical protein